MKRLDYNFSEYQESFNKIARKIVCESYDAEAVSDQIDEAQVTYNKIQKILNCPEMIKSHAYLYALDMENVDECDRRKVDKLYELGKARGVIQEDLPEQEPESDQIGECGDEFCDDQICGGPDDALTGQEMAPVEPKPAMSSAAYTVLYSAMKDGQVKTGEYFSSATDSDTAKTDCISNLAPLGYSSIRVLGIEQANDAVDMAVDTATIDEDDSKEFEEQETGSGDITEKPEEKPAEEPEKKDEKPAEEPEKKEEKSAEEPKDEPKAEEPKEEPKDEPKEPKAEEPEAEPKELTPTEKQVLRDEYVGMFKAELQKTKLEKSVEDMTVKEKAAFWNTIAKKWTKQDPEEFMSDKEIEKLNKTVIKNS